MACVWLVRQANCVPPGFMVPTGWAIVVDYYQNAKNKAWIPWSKPIVQASLAPTVTAAGTFGTTAFTVSFKQVRRRDRRSWGNGWSLFRSS
jgi:hypothetical protein